MKHQDHNRRSSVGTSHGEMLLALAANAASIGGQPIEKIKRLLQIAHEWLGTIAITAYVYECETQNLELIALPGIKCPEFMRGPADRPIFQWVGVAGQGPGIAWLENDEQFKKYGERLRRSYKPNRSYAVGDFRFREKPKNCRTIALARIEMCKGNYEDGRYVGQMYFNFPSDGKRIVFTSERRSTILAISHLVREILIPSLYPSESGLTVFKPEYLIRKLNATAEASRHPTKIPKFECQMANLLLEEAMRLTENYGGYAELVLLFGHGGRLARLFQIGSRPDSVRTILLSEDSLTRFCIENKRLFLGNPYQCSGALPRHLAKRRVQYPVVDRDGSKEFVNQFRTREYPSRIIIPIIHESEVRAVLRIKSKKENAFHHNHARAMADLEQFARQGIARFMEQRLRIALTNALDFYRVIGGVNSGLTEVMTGLVKALGAKWGTLWPLPRNSSHATDIGQGIRYPKANTVDFADENVGVRRQGGFTELLLRINDFAPGAFFCLHVLPERHRYLNGSQSSYYLQVFSPKELDTKIKDARPMPSESLWRYGFSQGDQMPLGAGKVALNRNTDQRAHTRVAFVFGGGNMPKNICWLIFRELHDLPWWERQYIQGLIKQLGTIGGMNALQLTVRNLRHLMPSLAWAAQARIENLRQRLPENDDDIQVLEAYARTMEIKLHESRALLPVSGGVPSPQESTGSSANPESNKVGFFINAAVRLVSPNHPVSRWTKIIERPADQSVNGTFYSILLNLVSNVAEHAKWSEYGEAQKHAVIWVRRRQKHIVCLVANVGHCMDKNHGSDLTCMFPSLGARGIGLPASVALARWNGGDLQFFTKEEYCRAHPRCPEAVARCDVFFEFSFPYK